MSININNILEITDNSIIDLDLFLKLKGEPVKIETSLNIKQEVDVSKHKRVLEEVCYKLPKGFPTIEDGKFVDRDEVVIMNEALQEAGLQTIELPEATRVKRVVVNKPQPIVGNDTSLKEGLVCLMYDAIADATFQKLITQTQQNNLMDKQPVDAKTISAIYKKLKAVHNSNGARYGATKMAAGEEGEDAASMPKNLSEYVKWAYETNDENAIRTVNNGLSAAISIQSNVGRGIIIRDNDFEEIRGRAVELARDMGIPNLKPDNWCPGDVYVLMSGADVDKAKQATKLPLLNKFFDRRKKIVACSLKEEVAQAGKATEFIKNVFAKGEFNAPIAQKDKLGTSDNKKTTALVSNIKRYQQYSQGFGKRKQNYVDALIDLDPSNGNFKVATSINTLLRAVGYDNAQLKQFRAQIKYAPKMSSTDFYKQNKKSFQQVDDVIKSVQSTINDSKPQLEAQFIKSRNAFIKELSKYGVNVAGGSSKDVLKGIYASVKKKDPLEVVSKKTATYELATLIMNKWAKRKGETSDAYKKIASVKNPFAALTAFAIAEAGISPSFWKIIGKDTNPIGEAHWFDNSVDVTIKTSKTSKINLTDNYDAAGFQLEYTTLLGTDAYDTRLVFRFADTAIRIEVQRLAKM